MDVRFRLFYQCGNEYCRVFVNGEYKFSAKRINFWSVYNVKGDFIGSYPTLLDLKTCLINGTITIN